MAITPLEQTLIDNARAHQEALAAHYPKHQAGQSNNEDHAEYLKHSGALTDLVSLTHFKSGLSDEAAEQLRQIEDEDVATFKQHFPVVPREVERAMRAVYVEGEPVTITGNAKVFRP